MQINTSEENNFHPDHFNNFNKQKLVETLNKWLKQSKKNKKQPCWNSLVYNLAKFLMPDMQMYQLLMKQQFFLQKIHHLLGLGKFKCQTLFNGVQIKLSQTFIGFDNSCKLQKVIMQGSQIIQVSSVETFHLIKRGDMTCQDRKQKMFMYNRQKNQKTIFLAIELKAIQRTKNDLFKQDHSNKLKFFMNYVFGQSCPSFCASGINILEIKENQCIKQNTHIVSGNLYAIYSGTFICYLENVIKNSKQNVDKNNQFNKIGSMKANNQNSRVNMNYSSKKQESSEIINKIELNKGSIIESSSFVQILKKINKQTIHKFRSCKAISKSVIFEIKSSEFYRAITLDEKSKKFFLNQYQKVLLSRRLLFSQSLSTLNKFFNKIQIDQSNQPQFSISRRKSYKGFRKTKSLRSSLDDMENLATVEIYDTMIKNKQKVLSLQRQYKQKNSSQQKVNVRFEDNKKMKQNYKRMKIKDYQIQKLVFRNSISNIKDPDGVKNIKSRFGQVKGMFQDQIQEVQNVIKQQRKAMLDVQMNKDNKNFKRKGIRLKSYSPQTASYFKHSLNYSKTSANSKRVSLAQSVITNCCQQIKQENTKKSIQRSDSVINTKTTIQNQNKKTNTNLPSTVDITLNGCQSNQRQFVYSPLKCITNLTQRDNRRTGRRAKTNFKPQIRRSSNFCPDSFANIGS